MGANAWGQEPYASVRFHRNNVRVSILPCPGSFFLSCGMFRAGGGDEHNDLRQFATHDVATMEAALAIAHAAIERCAYVWEQPTAQVTALAAQQHSAN